MSYNQKMNIKLHNTLSDKVEEIKTIKEKEPLPLHLPAYTPTLHCKTRHHNVEKMR